MSNHLFITCKRRQGIKYKTGMQDISMDRIMQIIMIYLLM